MELDVCGREDCHTVIEDEPLHIESADGVPEMQMLYQLWNCYDPAMPLPSVVVQRQ